MYQSRSIQFVEIMECNDWKIKLYSISYNTEKIDDEIIATARGNIINWLKSAENNRLQTYKVATLIIHKWSGGHFAIVNWWIDENMLQLFVYLATNENPTDFKLYSDKGIVTCVWEMEILWFERNAWVDEVLKKEINAQNVTNYLQQQLNK